MIQKRQAGRNPHSPAGHGSTLREDGNFAGRELLGKTQGKGSLALPKFTEAVRRSSW